MADTIYQHEQREIGYQAKIAGLEAQVAQLMRDVDTALDLQDAAQKSEANLAAQLTKALGQLAWIPVTEKLPETFVYDDSPCVLDGKPIPPAIHSKRVIVALNDGMVREDRLEGLQDHEPYWLAFRNRVVAWMPMPEAP